MRGSVLRGRPRRQGVCRLSAVAVISTATAVSLVCYVFVMMSGLSRGQQRRISQLEGPLQRSPQKAQLLQAVENVGAPRGDFEASSVDVTLVTQATEDRAWLLQLVCHRWQGYVSAAVLCNDKHAVDGGATIAQVASVAACASADTANLETFGNARWTGGSIARVASLNQGRLAVSLYVTNSTTRYPINALRNAAATAVATTHILALDIDFLPSIELYSALLAHSATLATSPRLAIIIPAFQRKGDSKFKEYSAAKWQKAILSSKDKQSFVPSTLAQLAVCLAAADCVVFDSTWNPEAHSTTDSAAWLELSAAYADRALRGAHAVLARRPIVLGRDPPRNLDPKNAIPPLRKLACFLSNRYEPYVVLRTDEAVAFDNSFDGYGKNKIEYVARLRYLGFAFSVLPVGFVCHCPHPISRDKRAWLKESRGKHSTDRLYKSRISDMVGKLKSGVIAARPNHTWLCHSFKTQPHKSAAPKTRTYSIHEEGKEALPRRGKLVEAVVLLGCFELCASSSVGLGEGYASRRLRSEHFRLRIEAGVIGVKIASCSTSNMFEV